LIIYTIQPIKGVELTLIYRKSTPTLLSLGLNLNLAFLALELHNLYKIVFKNTNFARQNNNFSGCILLLAQLMQLKERIGQSYRSS
jgi:hypothetical protein